jgi:chromate transporter
VAFALLLVGLPGAVALHPAGWLQIVDAFYRTGSLVFGGGHVVLPLLESSTVAPGWISQEQFLAGYGAVQAVPGPLFTFSAFLGALSGVGPGGIAGGLLALVAVYVPSWLLVLGALPAWERLRANTTARAALAGTNAAVVGLLLAALYDPVWTIAVTGPVGLAVALAAFWLLRFAACPPWVLVAGCAAAGALLF